MIYYTSDCHFFHNNIIRFCNRPFNNLEEMHEALIENWNKKIKPEDEIYVLGDFVFKCTDYRELYKILDQLNGKKHLIRGNHDHASKDPKFKTYWEEIIPYKEIQDNNRRVILMHYPLECWGGSHRGSYHLYGHTHEGDEKIGLKKLSHRYNVGVDVNDFEPKTLNELIEKWEIK